MINLSSLWNVHKLVITLFSASSFVIQKASVVLVRSLIFLFPFAHPKIVRSIFFTDEFERNR